MSTKPNPLAAFSIDELLEEVVRRRNDRAQRRPVESWCDECAHFKTKLDAGEEYNPCERGHRMSFWMPEEAEGPHAQFGYYRRVCKDRTAA